MQPNIDFNTEFKSLRQLKEFLNELPKEILDKELINDGFRDKLTLYEDPDGKTVYYM